MPQPPFFPTTLATALERLRAEDERLAADAQAALESLTWGEGLEVITQYELQQYLWYTLPRKVITELEHKRRLAGALGRLLELVGLPRYATICQSPETGAILEAYERSDREGLAAFRHAQDRSGIHPPDLPELTWGRVMGLEEATALGSVATMLELAISSGRFQPGAKGWRTAQQQVARQQLTLPRAELDDRTLLEAIYAERIQEWTRSHGPGRRELVAPVAAQLAHPAAFPAGAAEVVAPLRWLLEQAVDGGVPLTQKGNLARPLVLEAIARFGWDPLPNPPRGEDDVFELWVVRDLADQMRAVRRRGRRLHTTVTGRSLAADAEGLWRAVANQLVGGQDFGAMVTELVLLTLVDAGEQEILESKVVERVTAAMSGEGWHDRATGQPPDRETVRSQLWASLRPWKLLGLSRRAGDWQAPTLVLTEVGRATALEALRDRATGPRSDPHSR